ncbi:MAG: gas vesicle protein [Pseudomonadota bacterium]
MSTALTHATNSTSLADLLERILDKGIVISGDIRINLVDVELLSIQIRLIVCSVDRAKEMGIDWWTRAEYLRGSQRRETRQIEHLEDEIADLKTRLAAAEGLQA